MKLKIYDYSGKLKATVSPEDSSTHEWGVMIDNVINLSFVSSKFIPLRVRDYIRYRGLKFTLQDDYRPEKVSSVDYKYDVTFYGPESEGRNVMVLKMVEGDEEPIFPLTDKPRAHLQLIVDNLNRARGYDYWMVGEVIDGPNEVIEYNLAYCFDALGDIAKKFNTEWWIESNTINLSRCENGDMLVLGYLQGLTQLSKEKNETVRFFTRLYPLGSTRNIDREKYGHQRLQLPGGEKYVEQNTHLGIIEYGEEEAFSGIFPKRIGIVGDVRKETLQGETEEFDVYYFKDPELTFDPNDYEIGGLVKMIVFQENSVLNGRDFEVNFNSETREFEIITQFPYENMQLPGGSLIPKAGDEYILYNLRMPDEYYSIAEEEYRQAVDEFLAQGSIDTAIYKGATDYIDLNERNVNLRPGRRVKLVSPEYFGYEDIEQGEEFPLESGTRDSRITKITARLTEPNDASIECAYAVSPSHLSKMENDILEIQAAFREKLDQEGILIIKSTDSTDPSEYNVFSARRSLREFLSKRTPDEAKAYINFAAGIGILGKLFNNIIRVGDQGQENEPSNQSVFSSLRTKREIEDALEGLDARYLRKDIEDIAQKLITFMGGIDVHGAGVFRETLNSPDFISGFLEGKGWAIIRRLVDNVAGIPESRSYAEFDEVTVRKSLRVFELIINQLKGESDNYIFSGMMKVQRVDRAARKIYLDTGGGVLYNPFREDDCLRCQRFGGMPSAQNDYNLIKQYDLIVSAAGMGSGGQNRLDWIEYGAFDGDESDIDQGDILVRIDNISDPSRKGVIMNTALGYGAPYMDVVYGLITDPENAVRSRFGNLEGIYNAWFGWLKGFGAYVQNLYAIGEFHLRTGESVRTKLDIMENLFRVDMQHKSYNLTEEDNFLRNATFTEGMEFWEHETDIAPFFVGGLPLMFNGNMYSNKEAVAGVVGYEGRNMLRIKYSGIRQFNEYIRKPEDPDSVLYLSFKFICKTGGKLNCGFQRPGEPMEGELQFISETIDAGQEFEIRTYSGTWNGEGDFLITFTGDIYIDLLSVTNRPLDDFKLQVSTSFEQTHERITLLGERVDETEGTVSQLGIELNAAKEEIRIWGEKTDDNKATITQLGIDLSLTDERLTLYANKTDDIENTVSEQGLRIDAHDSMLELFSDFKDSASGTMNSLSLRMDSAEGRIETIATRVDSHSNSLISMGNSLNLLTGRVDTYVSITNEILGDITTIGIRMDGLEGSLTSYVQKEEFNGFKGDVDATFTRHWTAIEQTDRNILLSLNKVTGVPLFKDMLFNSGSNGLLAFGTTVKHLKIWSGTEAPTSLNYPASTWVTTAQKSQHVGDVYRRETNGTYYTYSSSYTWVAGTPEFGIPSAEQGGIIRVVKSSGSIITAPGLGGVRWATMAAAGEVYEIRIKAKFPAGYSLNHEATGIGEEGKIFWLTDAKGTGSWKEYRIQVFCAETGVFGVLARLYITKDNFSGSYTGESLTWYISEATIFDLAGYEDPITYINLSESGVKIKGERIELEGYTTINGGFTIDEEGNMHAQSGTFGGYIRTPLKRLWESDAQFMGYEGSDTRKGRYLIKKDLNLISGDVPDNGILWPTVVLPNDLTLEGAHIILQNCCYSPYTRVEESMRHTTVVTQNGSQIRGVPADRELSTWDDPRKVKFLNGTMELVSVPVFSYNSSTGWSKTGIEWVIKTLNAVSWSFEI